MNKKSFISSEEEVIRILSNDWVVNGALQQTAFVLRDGETCISVNRPAVTSFPTDIISFVKTHKNFVSTKNGDLYYQRAKLNVGDVRNITVLIDNAPLAIDVEVEPRDIFTKSHAGIFTRRDNITIKNGDTLVINQEKNISADMILLKVRLALLHISTVETCFI